MRKIHKAILALLCAAAMLASVVLSVAQSFAADFTYKAINGTTAQFDVILVMPSGIQCPDSSFVFGIAPGTAIAGTDTTLDVYAGPAGAKLGSSESYTVEFTGSTPVYTSAQNRTGSVGGGEKDAAELGADQQYAKLPVTVNLTGCSFNKPGFYRYVITQTTGTYSFIEYDPNSVQYLDVYVVQNSEGVLSVGGYVLHTNPDVIRMDGTLNAGDVKKGGFKNTYAALNELTIRKTVSGNFGNKSEYFPITVTLSGAGTGSHEVAGSFTASIPANKGRGAARTNPSSLTVPASGNITQTFYLASGEHITIKGILMNAGYIVAEDASIMGNEGYKATITTTGDTAGVVTSNPEFRTSDSSMTEDTTVAIDNRIQGAVPTGIIMSIIPYIVIAGGAILLIMIAKKKKRK